MLPVRGIVTHRVLGVSDEPLLQEFLRGYRDSSMFLRSNLREAGIVDKGKPYQGTYVGAFDGARLAWREVGEGRAVVLIHGLFSDATTN